MASSANVTARGPTKRRLLAEIIVVVVIVLLYVATQRWIADRWYFVLPAIMTGLAACVSAKIQVLNR